MEVTLLRTWEMPNRYTFRMRCIQELFMRWRVGKGEGVWVDPFCGINSPATLTNDADETLKAESHQDGLEFLRGIPNTYCEGVLFDPPYSTEQALRKYTPKYNGTAGREEYWARCKEEIARIIRLGGIAICFGWNSNGIGKTRGFELREVLLVCHGAAHNDTIVTVEEKLR